MNPFISAMIGSHARLLSNLNIVFGVSIKSKTTVTVCYRNKESQKVASTVFTIPL